MNHMHLRSGTSIASGSVARTKVSTQASGTQAKSPLKIIEEGTPSTTSDSSSQSTSEASATMEDFQNLNLEDSTSMDVNVALLGYGHPISFHL